MGADDWYRGKRWNDAVREEFFKRLKRARSVYNQAQYLRIKADYLYDKKKPENLAAAIELVDTMISEYPDDTQLAAGNLLKAKCLQALGQTDDAAAAFQAAIQAERDCRTHKSFCWLEYGYFVVELGLKQRYAEVLDLFDEFQEDTSLLLVSDRYEYHAVLAVISAHRRRKKAARENAEAALAQAKKKHSGFRYHPTVGLVKNTDTPVQERLLAIAEG